MKTVSYRATIGDRQLFSMSRVAVPEHRVNGMIEDAFRETAHALMLCGDVGEETYQNDGAARADVDVRIAIADYRRV